MPNNRDYSVTMNGQGSRSTNGGTPVISSEIFMHADRSATDSKRHKPRGRWVPPTAYSMSETSWRNPNGSYAYFVAPTNFGNESGVLPFHESVQTKVGKFHTNTGIPGTFPSDLSNRALQQARNNLKGNSLDIGVAWGERKETASFIGDLYHAGAELFTAWKDLRKLKTRKAEKKLSRALERITGRDTYDTFKKIPQLRLQWQYAVKPMMNDIYSACKALEDHSRDAWKVTVKGKSHFKAETEVPVSPTSSRDQCMGYGEIWYGCMVRIDVQPGNTALRKASEFGLTNPVNLAWELIPLSFVIDWCYPVGDYLSSLDAMVGWELLGYSSSNFTRKKYKFTGTNRTIGSLKVLDASWTASYRTVALSRSIASSVPFPVLPSMKDPRSHSHVADGFALFAQALRKFK